MGFRHPERLQPGLLVVAAGPSFLDALLSAGTIDGQQHAAGLAYAALRLRHDTAKHGGGLSSERWAAVKRDHAALLAAAGFDRFLLDRLCLDGEAPLRCEVGRVRAFSTNCRASRHDRAGDAMNARPVASAFDACRGCGPWSVSCRPTSVVPQSATSAALA